MSDLALIREALRDPAIAAYPDFSKAVSDMCDQLERFRSERGYVVGCNDGFEVGVDQASQVAYRVCAETRHVTLGDKAAAAIRALSGKEARHQLCSDCADTSAISTSGDDADEALSFASRFKSGSLTEAGWTVHQVAESKSAENGRFSQPFQDRVQPWMIECFGPMIAGDREERNHRFLEEALELVQACGCTSSEAHQLVDYVYGRPMGEPHQEAGGVMVTLAALCLANALDMHEAGETELARVWTKVETIRAKQAAKPKHSPLPVASRIDGGRFEAWTLTDFAAECRAQSRDQLDPDFSRFMAELAIRLTATSTGGAGK